VPGTPAGAKKMRETYMKRYTPEQRSAFSRMGGLVSRGGGFAANRALAVEAGRKGGKISKRGKNVRP
jgi:general stress protein YciG